MPGLKITLPYTFGDTTLPLVTDDPLFCAGSLLLIDPAHSLNDIQNATNNWKSAGVGVVPADVAAIPNLAYAQAVPLIAGSSQATLAGTMKRGQLTGVSVNYHDLSGVYGLFERTSKGGLHGITSLTHGDSASGFVDSGILFPAAIQTYMHTTNPAHSYFTSIWVRKTRAAVGRGQLRVLSAMHGGAAATSHYQWMFNETGGLPNAGPQLGARYPGTASDASGAAYVNNVGYSAETGTAWSGIISPAVMWSSADAVNSFTYVNGQIPSFIFYRFYVEDLTVSGRTYAAADTLDQAAFAAAFAVGGRYNADTFTAPAIA